jgi:tRNA modification GTPase
MGRRYIILGAMTAFTPEDPIAALATPWGESALAVIRISGKDSLSLLERLFRFPDGGSLSESRGYRLRLGHFVEGPDVIDRVLIGVYRSGHSYTGEEAAEITCHGGKAIIQRILEVLYRSGFRQANPGEFTLRAFLNGRLDLTRAEAVNEIIRSKTDRARALALDRLSGKIEGKINELKARLVKLRASVEVNIDYPEEDLPESFQGHEEAAYLEDQLDKLIATYRTGKIVQEGVSVVIAGRTNAGKSTLFNLLLKEDRAIVSETHGTTRDYLEGMIAVDGIPIRLFDTAGLRATEDRLEREGMLRSERIIQNAGLMLFLVDATQGFQEEDRIRMDEYRRNVEIIPLWSKVDLLPKPRKGAAEKPPEGFLGISAETGEGLSELHEEISRRLFGGTPAETEQPIIDSARQRDLLADCLESVRRFRRGLAEKLPLDILAEDLKEALEKLGEITGEVAPSEVLEQMFSRFCVGK